MPESNDAQPTKGAWTKDHVEHLRTVHFALLTISCGLFVFALTYHPQKIQHAIDQMNRIINLQGLGSQSTLIDALGLSQARSSQSAISVALGFSGASSDTNRELRFVSVPWSHDGKAFRTPRGMAFPLDDMSDTFPFARLETLDDMAALWNKPDVVKHVLVVEQSLDSNCTIWNPDRNEWVDLPPLETPSSGGMTAGQLTWTARKEADRYLLSAASTDRKPPRVKCDGLVKSIATHSYLVERLQPERGRLGDSFNQAFPELSEMVDASDRSQKLEAIREQLRAERRAKSSDFEAFGLHIPQEIAGPCGIVVILVVQWYFFLHLRELGKQYSVDASGWAVAWIGIYRSGAARLTFGLSVTLVPAAVVITLVRQAPPELASWLLLPAGAFSLMMGIVVLLYMPKRSAEEKEERVTAGI
jgi:hypothetical protein